MAYTVKKLAEISGVSVRTLHFYDEIGLLTPAFMAENGYRYYEEAQLLSLQQILFFKELGFELKEIQKIISQKDFDISQALAGHKKTLLDKIAHLRELIKTIDKTTGKLKGETTMQDEEMYQGFSPEKQAEYEAYLINRYGDQAKKHIEESKEAVKDWDASKHQQTSEDAEDIFARVAKLAEHGAAADSKEVQDTIRQHYNWIKQFWIPDRESYIGLGQGYTELEWKKWFERYDPNHPKLAKFMAEAMKIFAEREL